MDQSLHCSLGDEPRAGQEQKKSVDVGLHVSFWGCQSSRLLVVSFLSTLDSGVWELSATISRSR